MTEPALGDRIRRRRQELGLSLRELGARTELTAGFLSQVEKDRVSPSLASLQRIAAALGVPMFYFLGEAGLAAPVVRAAERRRLHFPDSHIAYDLVTPDFTRKMIGFVLRMEPGVRRAAARLARPTEECLFVLQGRLEVTVGDSTHLLDQGDSIYYDGQALREFASAGDREAVVLCFMTPPAL